MALNEFKASRATFLIGGEDLLPDDFFEEEMSFVGFDVEYIKNEVKLIQLCGPRSCILLRMNGKKELPPPVIKLLADDSILKAGVGVNGKCFFFFSSFINK